MSVTLKDLLKEYPEWADLPIAVLKDGELHFLSDSGMVYEDEDDVGPILVMSGN